MPGVQWFPWRTSVDAASGGTAISPPSSSSAATATAAANAAGAVAAINTSPFANGIKVLCAIRDLSNPPDAFQWDGSWFGHPGTELIDFYAGTPTLREMIDQGVSAEDIVLHFRPDAELFLQRRKPYLLY